MYQILLYYKYVNIADPEEFKNHQISLCQKLGIKGRIIIASEGINGTLGGSQTATKKYIVETQKYPGIGSLDCKV